MIEEVNFETFLYISKNKYQIFVLNKIDSKNLYNKEIKTTDEDDSNNLSKFLDDNIYKIEKILSNFIRNIILIIEDDKVLSTSISIKKKDYEKHTDQKYLKNSLIEVKDIFRENYQDQIIMHMIINKNKNKDNSLLNNVNSNVDYLYLEVNFTSISKNFTYIFDKILENHQIKISRYMSSNYIENFFSEDKAELSLKANKLANGLNKNEVQLVSKTRQNKGFFERFFQLFS